MLSSEPRIIFLNQSISPEFLHMTAEVAQTAGECVLYTGSRESGRQGNLEIRHAPGYRKTSILSRLWTWSKYTVSVFCSCLFMPGKPVLFVATNPPLLPFVAFLFHHLRKWEYVVLVWDIYPDVLVRFRRLTERNLIVRLWRRLSKSALAAAREVVTISPGMARTLQAHLGASESSNCSIQVIPSWVDTNYIRPLSKTRNWFAQQHKLMGKLTVLYSGNMGITHDLDTLVKVAARLAHIDGITFLLIGDGPGRQVVERMMARHNVTNVILLPRQPYDVVPYSMSSGDVAIVSLDRGAEGLSMPSRTYSMLAAGCALIGVSCAQSDLAELIEEHALGVNVAPGDAEALIAAILRFYRDREYLGQCQENARRAAEKCFSAEAALQTYKSLLFPLVGVVSQ